VVKFIFISLFISLSLYAQSETLVDPTAPLNFQPPQKKVKPQRNTLPTLQSIVIKAGKPQAIMNNKAYQQGQRIGRYRITLIDNKKVLLELQNKTYKLTLYSSSEQFTH